MRSTRCHPARDIPPCRSCLPCSTPPRTGSGATTSWRRFRLTSPARSSLLPPTMKMRSPRHSRIGSGSSNFRPTPPSSSWPLDDPTSCPSFFVTSESIARSRWTPQPLRRSFMIIHQPTGAVSWSSDFKSFSVGLCGLTSSSGFQSGWTRHWRGGVVARFHLAPPPTSVNRRESALPAGLVHAESVKLYTAIADLRLRSSRHHLERQKGVLGDPHFGPSPRLRSRTGTPGRDA